RSGNPTRDLLGEAIATLEGGATGVITSSGLSALTLCFTALVKAGGRIVAPHDCYGGTWRLLNHLAGLGHFTVDYVNQTDPQALAAALEAPVDLVLIETPSNPLLRLVDLKPTIETVHAAGALAVADNTFCSPLRQRPIEFGADVVVHSTTKFINGHSDVVGGAVIAADEDLGEHLKFWANVIGVTAGAFDSWLALRGLRTLDARVRVHDANAAEIVDTLTSHPAVTAIYYPGLAEHPGHEIAVRQQNSFGSMISFGVVGGLAGAAAFCRGLRVFDVAESLGGVESLIAHPASMTHASMTPEVQLAAGITPALLRLSAGIEPASDLVADVRDGLERALKVDQ
ncbi:MAG: aminotransferase class I/II-fold pyridoxal phosphate-dependent enzyme, partial [Propionicimonas sp.]|nr:aminotransferase class I/II-fold pyridoxal phosphate-dependent enzyme [Propionicimonas sp.]